MMILLNVIVHYLDNNGHTLLEIIPYVSIRQEINAR